MSVPTLVQISICCKIHTYSMSLNILPLFYLVLAILACSVGIHSEARIENSVQCSSCYNQTNKDILQSPHGDVHKCWDFHNYEEVRNAIFWWESHSEYVDIATVLIEIFKIIIPCADDTCAIFKMFVEPKTKYSLASDDNYKLYDYLKHSEALQQRRAKRYDTPKEVLDILPLLPGISEPCLHKIIHDHREYVALNLFENIIEPAWPTTTKPITYPTIGIKITMTEKTTPNLKTTVTSTPTTTTMETTTVTSTIPVTSATSGVRITTPPVRCTTCSGIHDCVVSPATNDCGGDHLCYVTVVDQTSGARHIEKGCKSFHDCYNEWWRETSDRPECVGMDEFPTGDDITCTFCCTGDMCNSNNNKLIPQPLWSMFRKR